MSSRRESTSITLIESVRNDAPGAWDRFVQIYSPLVYHWCHTKSRLSREDTADVMQDVFLSVSKSIASFQRDQQGSSLRAWMRVITLNKIRTLAKRVKRQPAAVGGTEAQRWAHSLPEANVSADDDLLETSILMRKAIEILRDRFNSSTYTAFWLVAMEGRSTDDVAETLGLSGSAVRQACYRVRKRLRDELGGI